MPDRFRKKPVEVEAIRWDGQDIGAVWGLIGDDKLPAAPDDPHINPGLGHVPALGTLDIPTLEGTMTAQPGDWIIKGVAGEIYPCKPDIFKATYESAADPAPQVKDSSGTFNSPESSAILLLRSFMCCPAGREQVERELIRPFGYVDSAEHDSLLVSLRAEVERLRAIQAQSAVAEGTADRLEALIAGSGSEPYDEETCHRCGRACTVWSAESPLWNAVIRGGSILGDPEHGDMVCPTCFMQLAEAKGIATQFRVTADVVNVELETVTPSGRTWDAEQFLWIKPEQHSGEGNR